MSSARALDVIDIARALGDCPLKAIPQQVCEWIKEEYARKSGGGFNYDPCMSVIYDSFRGGHTAASAVHTCNTTGNPKGRKQNATAIAALMPYILENQSTCHRIGLTAFAIGRFGGQSVFAKIKAPLLRVRGHEAYVVMPGLRMSHRPSEVAIDVACSVALAILTQGDMARAEFEYLYAGPGIGRDRSFRAIHGTGRKRYSEAEIDQLLHTFVEGVALAAEAGVSVSEPELRGYRIIDPRQPNLW